MVLRLEMCPNRRRVHATCLYDGALGQDRKSTRLNSSHVATSYAVFCLKKKMVTEIERLTFSSCSSRLRVSVVLPAPDGDDTTSLMPRRAMSALLDMALALLALRPFGAA